MPDRVLEITNLDATLRRKRRRRRKCG